MLTTLLIFIVAGIAVAAFFLILRLKILNNRRLLELLNENYETSKILVRRDMELSEANTRLIALDESKSEFVSIAAHQLRTPLTGIKWAFNELLDKSFGKLNVEQYKMIDTGLQSTLRMIDLVNDLLNVARIEEGRFGLNLKKQSLLQFIVSVTKPAQRAASEKDIEFTLGDISDTIFVEIDEEKMIVAIENLLDNAIKYTPPGGKVNINISIVGEKVKITIRDTGIGIPKDEFHKAFLKFFRAENALRFQTAGTGLGLYVVKNVIEKHNGTVNIESIENKGTTVTIVLPIAK